MERTTTRTLRESNQNYRLIGFANRVVFVTIPFGTAVAACNFRAISFTVQHCLFRTFFNFLYSVYAALESSIPALESFKFCSLSQAMKDCFSVFGLTLTNVCLKYLLRKSNQWNKLSVAFRNPKRLEYLLNPIHK